MKDCPSERQWDAFVDGDLAASRHAELMAHLGDCDPCRATVAEIVSLRSLLATLPEPTAPDSLAPAVMAAIASEPVPSPGEHFRRVTLASLFGLFAVLEAVLTVLKGYGYTVGELLARLARYWPALGELVRQADRLTTTMANVLSNPIGLRIFVRSISTTPWFWPALLLVAASVLILVPRLRTLKGAERR